MATAAQSIRLNVVSAVLRRNRMLLGHGALILAVATFVFIMPSRGSTLNFLLWGLLAAESCLLGFWVVLVARPAAARGAYGIVLLCGLVFCVMAAGQLHLDPHWSPYATAANLRDVPVLFLASALTAGILRARGWRLNQIAANSEPGPGSTLKLVQFSLDDFGKWLTLLCILLGLSVSLLPQFTVMWESLLWQTTSRHYLVFVEVVCLPAASAVTLLLWLVLQGRALHIGIVWRALAVWGMTTGILLLNTAILVGLRGPYDYYLRHEPYMLPAFATWAVVVAATAYLCGWSVSRIASQQVPLDTER